MAGENRIACLEIQNKTLADAVATATVAAIAAVAAVTAVAAIVAVAVVQLWQP